MKTLTIFLALMILTVTSANSATNDCSNIKKNSPKYLLCKTKAAGSAVKDKLSKKDKSEKKGSFFDSIKKWKNSKSLSDFNK